MLVPMFDPQPNFQVVPSVRWFEGTPKRESRVRGTGRPEKSRHLPSRFDEELGGPQPKVEQAATDLLRTDSFLFR